MTTSKLTGAPDPGALRAPDRCTDRPRRLLKVKFVAFPAPASEPAPSRLSVFINRAFGFLAVARR